MKRSLLIATAVLLAACTEIPLKPPIAPGEARLQNGFDLTTTAVPNPHAPNVFVVGSNADSYLVVDQEPIVIQTSGAPVSIAWALPGGTGYSFGSDQAISVDDPKVSDFKCHVNGKAGKSITCTYSVKRPGLVKYSITVRSPSEGTLSLDPFMRNL